MYCWVPKHKPEFARLASLIIIKEDVKDICISYMNLRSCIMIQTIYVNGLLMAQEFSFPSNPNAGRANRAQFTQQVSWDSWRLIFFSYTGASP